jgi:hypothetical protein
MASLNDARQTLERLRIALPVIEAKRRRLPTNATRKPAVRPGTSSNASVTS